MKNILVVGAGKSSLFLIEYLLRHASEGDYRVVVADADRAAAAAKINGHPAGITARLDATSAIARASLVRDADVVCSLLPPALHVLLAHDCLTYNKPLITASYVSDDLRALDTDVRTKGLLFMCEMGLDPGIDHMTAMDIIHGIQEQGGKLVAFRSYCGGLIAPESDDNPWHYKFTWNPRNIVVAGQAGAVYKEEGRELEVPYTRLFKTCETIDIASIGPLAYYLNRDSLAYPALYGAEDAPAFLRATLRHPDFCTGWAALVALGLTDTKQYHPVKAHTYASFTRIVAGLDSTENIEAAVAKKLSLSLHSTEMNLLRWLGIFDEVPLPQESGAMQSPADVLLALLLSRWTMQPEDKDMVVMQHEFDWIATDGGAEKITSTLVVKGDGGERTAMAKTVGLPMGILARMVLNGDPNLPTGVCIPTMPEVYKPVLRELEAEGIRFVES